MKLQEIRARQALEEIGRGAIVKINHQVPQTSVDDVIYSLIFPKFLLEYPTEKSTSVLFVGKITPSRQEFLDRAKSLYPQAEVFHSLKGRIGESKARDNSYFEALGKAKFALCPNGDFVWTYRFFEAVLLKAIPVVEESCDLYAGYKHYKLGDVLEYREDWVSYNLEKCKREMML